MMSPTMHEPDESGKINNADTDCATAKPSADLDTGLLLAIDTATSAMSVALLNGKKTLTEVNSVVERNHSVYLIPAIEEALANVGLGPRNLQGLAVGRGPGSYTGVRIGITIAKTMAWTAKLPVAAVSSLEALAAGALATWMIPGRYADWVRKKEESVLDEEGIPLIGPADREGNGLTAGSFRRVWVVPVLNARRGQVFTSLLELRQTAAADGPVPDMWPAAEPGWSTRREDGIRLMESWVDELLELARREEEPPEAVLFAGETKDFIAATERFAREAVWGTGAVRTEALPYDIQAEFIGYLGALRLASGRTDDPHTLLPNYTQLAEAEVKLAAKSQSGE